MLTSLSGMTNQAFIFEGVGEDFEAAAKVAVEKANAFIADGHEWQKEDGTSLYDFAHHSWHDSLEWNYVIVAVGPAERTPA